LARTIGSILVRGIAVLSVVSVVIFAIISVVGGIGCCLRLSSNELTNQPREGIPRRWDQNLRELGTNEILAVVLENPFSLSTAECDDTVNVDRKDHVWKKGQDESLPSKLGVQSCHLLDEGLLASSGCASRPAIGGSLVDAPLLLLPGIGKE